MLYHHINLSLVFPHEIFVLFAFSKISTECCLALPPYCLHHLVVLVQAFQEVDDQTD